MSLRNKLKLSSSQILVMGFGAVIILGAILLSLPIATVDGQGLEMVDALFEATSAVCVTGLVVVDTGTDLTMFGQIVILVLVQVGGLGFMTFATLLALMMGKKIGLRERILMREALNQIKLEGVVKLTRRVMFTTVVIELVAALILTLMWWKDMGFNKALYFGIFHSVTAFCNAGFDLFGNYSSLTSQVNNIGVNIVIAFLIIIGGLGFTVLMDITFRRSWSSLSLHSKVVLLMSAIFIVIGTLSIFIAEYNNPATIGNLPLSSKLMASFFQGVTPRTAGFNTIDVTQMHVVSQFLIILLMFIGASPNSTGGGVKTTTIGALLVAVWAIINGREDVEIFKRRLPQKLIFRALAIVTIGSLGVILVTTILAFTDEGDFMVILFEAVSAFGTVGLSLGLTSVLSTPGKLVIIMTMFMGRVGPLTLAMALMNRNKPQVIRQPEAKIMVG